MTVFELILLVAVIVLVVWVWAVAFRLQVVQDRLDEHELAIATGRHIPGSPYIPYSGLDDGIEDTDACD